MGNLGFKDTVMSSNLLKLRRYLLELLLILFIDGNLLVYKLLYKVLSVRFRLGMIEGLLFCRESRWVLRFSVWVYLGVQLGRWV